MKPVTDLHQRRLGGKETLPRKRRKYRETPDTAGAARRLIFSVGERIAKSFLLSPLLDAPSADGC